MSIMIPQWYFNDDKYNDSNLKLNKKDKSI